MLSLVDRAVQPRAESEEPEQNAALVQLILANDGAFVQIHDGVSEQSGPEG